MAEPVRLDDIPPTHTPHPDEPAEVAKRLATIESVYESDARQVAEIHDLVAALESHLTPQAVKKESRR